MIAVIADDFTGAAEIGGVGLQFGLTVSIETQVSGAGKPDLLVVAADTRSMPEDKACSRIEQITEALLQLQPRLIYKKMDSVLRGHVYAELEVQRRLSGKQRVLLVPANPHFNRIIRDGVYYVEEVPLDQTSFANDPEFPHKTSQVCQLIGPDPKRIRCLNVHESLPAEGFLVGNVGSEADLDCWAKELDKDTVYAGGAGYFQAILERDYSRKFSERCYHQTESESKFFVFGSTFPKTTAFVSRLEQAGMAFFNLSENYFREAENDPRSVDELAKSIANRIQQDRNVVLTTIFTPSTTPAIHPETVREHVGLLVKAVFQHSQVDNLYIEGGATASQIFQNLNMTRLTPVCELDYGIIQMKVEGFPGMMLVTKPGSYRWPDCIVQQPEALQ